MNIQKPHSFIINGFFVLLLAVGIVSCSSKSELANHIPKDANLVMAFDVKSMGIKSLDFKEIMSLQNIKKAFGSLTQKDTTGNFFKNSGLDLMNKGYFFMKIAEAGQYGAVIAALSDANKLEGFLKEMKNDIAITEEGSFKLAGVDESTMIAWNKSEVIFLFGGANPKETILSVANLQKSESLASTNDSFAGLEKESADIALWMSFEDLGKLAAQYNASPTMSAMSFKDTYLTATCNFEDGQIVVDSKYTGSKETADKFNFVKANVSSDVANALPGQSVIGMLGFALDMEKLYTYLEQEKLVETYGAMATQMTGLTAKEFLTMLSGDIAITVNGVEMKDVPAVDWNTGQVTTRKEPVPDYCAVIGIADKDRAVKMLTQFSAGGMLTKKDNYYTFQDKVFIIEKGSLLVVTGSESTKQAVLDGNGEKLSTELNSTLTGNASAFYLNLNNIPEAAYASNPVWANNMKESSLEDIIFTGATPQGNVTAGKFVFRFKEKNENSLVIIARMSKKYSKLMEEATVAASAQAEDPTSVSN